jgi:hypothetical protein
MPYRPVGGPLAVECHGATFVFQSDDSAWKALIRDCSKAGIREVSFDQLLAHDLDDALTEFAANSLISWRDVEQQNAETQEWEPIPFSRDTFRRWPWNERIELAAAYFEKLEGFDQKRGQPPGQPTPSTLPANASDTSGGASPSSPPESGTAGPPLAGAVPGETPSV